MSSIRRYQIAWLPGLIAGCLAFIAGYLLTRHFVLLGPPPSTAYEAGNMTVSGWVYYNAHTVPLSETASLFGESMSATGYDLITNEQTSPYFKFLYVIPPIVLFTGGILTAAGFGRTSRLSFGMLNGASVLIGYLVATTAGVFYFQKSVTAFGATGTLGPSFLSAVVVAGFIYPALFGGLGGIAYLLSRGSISISVDY